MWDDDEEEAQGTADHSAHACKRAPVHRTTVSRLVFFAVTGAIDADIWPHVQASPTFKKPGCAMDNFMHAARAGTAVHW